MADAQLEARCLRKGGREEVDGPCLLERSTALQPGVGPAFYSRPVVGLLRSSTVEGEGGRDGRLVRKDRPSSEREKKSALHLSFVCQKDTDANPPVATGEGMIA